MWQDPAKRFSDGTYYVDYSAAGLALAGYLRWRHIANTVRVETIVEKQLTLPLIGSVFTFQRYQVSVDWEETSKAVDTMLWAWLPKFYQWMDAGNRSGADVLAEVLCYAKQADLLQRRFRTLSSARLAESIRAGQAVAERIGTYVGALEMTRDLSISGLSILSALGGPLAKGVGIGTKATISAIDMRGKGVSVVNTALNVGADILIDVGEETKTAGKLFCVAAKTANRTIGAYMSGKDLPESAISGLAEAVAAATGLGAEKSLAWVKVASRSWMIPLTIRGAPLARALAELNLSAGAVKLVEEGAKAKVESLASAQGRTKPASIPTFALLVADIGRYEQLIRANIRKLA